MSNLPDAPWIRDAEDNGIDDEEPVTCPVCGKDCNDIYIDNDFGIVVGCDKCIRKYDAAEWFAEQT